MSDVKAPAEQTTPEKLAQMRREGWDQFIPSTERTVRLRSIEPIELLESGECPDILTPLMIRSVYEDMTDVEVRGWMAKQESDVATAKKFMAMLNIICEKSIMDGTPVSELTISEKRFIFRFAVGLAETLVLFRYRPQKDVEPVRPSDTLSPVAEPVA